MLKRLTQVNVILTKGTFVLLDRKKFNNKLKLAMINCFFASKTKTMPPGWYVMSFAYNFRKNALRITPYKIDIFV